MSGETRPEPSSQTLALERIDSAPFQIRQSIDEDRLRELASSMDRSGLLQPILVRPKGERFEVVAGERRFRAAKLLQWSIIACRVAELSDVDAAVDKIIENEQRADANPLERARAFAHLRDALHLEQDEIARRIGLDKSVVSRTLALLRQPAEIQKLVAEESISLGHVRSLDEVGDASKRVELAAQAAKERLSVRETQRRAREAARRAGSKPSDGGARASAPAETPNQDAQQSSSATPLPSPEVIAKPHAEIQKIAGAHKAFDPEAPAAPAHSPLAPVERQAPDAAALQRQPIEQRIASWCIAIGSTVRGPWRNAAMSFYERMTDLAFWWRVVKRVLKFLDRFIPYGHDYEPSPLSKAIKEAFAEVNRHDLRSLAES